MDIAKVTMGIALFSLGACASTPDISVRYYLPKSEAAATVTRTLTCNAANHMFLATSADVTISHVADLDAPVSVDLGDFDGTFSNTGFELNLTEDGRLSGINATSDGQAGETIRSALELVSSFIPFARSETFMEECEIINGRQKTDKGVPVRTATLSIVYRGTIDLSNTGLQNLTRVTQLPSEYAPVLAKLPNMQAKVTPQGTTIPTVGIGPIAKGTTTWPNQVAAQTKYPEIKLRQPQRFSVQLSTVNTAGSLSYFQSANIYQETISGTKAKQDPYILLLPKAAAFGETSFELSVADSGAVTELNYGQESGGSELFDLGGTIVDTLSGDSVSEQLNEVRAQADLIAQQARLVRCQANPTECT